MFENLPENLKNYAMYNHSAYFAHSKSITDRSYFDYPILDSVFDILAYSNNTVNETYVVAV